MADFLEQSKTKEIKKDYYNEEQKKKYLKEKEKEKKSKSFLASASVQLRKVSDMECELDKDVSNWTIYEITEYYKLLNMTSFDSLRVVNNMLSLYTQFCLQDNFVKDNQNHFLECTPEVLSSCLNKAILNKKIVSRETILQWIDKLPNAKDQFILLSLFEYGKSKNFIDIVNVKQSDCDKENHTLTLSNRTVNISDELIDIIEKCECQKVYYSMSDKNKKTMPLVDNGFIIKEYPNTGEVVSAFQKGRNIYVGCQRIFDYLGIGQWMTTNDISESGKVYMIKKEAELLNITPKEYLYSQNIRKVEEQFGCEIRARDYIKKYKEYLV